MVAICLIFSEIPFPCHIPQYLYELTFPPTICNGCHSPCLYHSCYLCSFCEVISNVALICISLMIRDVDHQFRYVLVICASFLEKISTILCPSLDWIIQLFAIKVFFYFFILVIFTQLIRSQRVKGYRKVAHPNSALTQVAFEVNKILKTKQYTYFLPVRQTYRSLDLKTYKCRITNYKCYDREKHELRQ